MTPFLRSLDSLQQPVMNGVHHFNDPSSKEKGTESSCGRQPPSSWASPRLGQQRRGQSVHYKRAIVQARMSVVHITSLKCVVQILMLVGRFQSSKKARRVHDKAMEGIRSLDPDWEASVRTTLLNRWLRVRSGVRVQTA